MTEPVGLIGRYGAILAAEGRAVFVSSHLMRKAALVRQVTPPTGWLSAS